VEIFFFIYKPRLWCPDIVSGVMFLVLLSYQLLCNVVCKLLLFGDPSFNFFIFLRKFTLRFLLDGE